MEVLLLSLGFVFAFDVFWLYINYKSEIARKSIVLIPASWYNTKRIPIYFSLFAIFVLINIPFIAITFSLYSDNPYMKALMFLISLSYAVLAVVIKNMILRLITKNFKINNKNISDYFLSDDSGKDEEQ